MTRLARAVFALAAVLVAPLLVAAQVHADTITIHDLTEGTPTITQTGTSTHVTLVPCGPPWDCSGEALNFTIDAITPAGNPVTQLNGGPFSFPEVLVSPFALAEPGFPLAEFSPVSDTVYPQFVDPETVLIHFASDSDSAPLTLCGHFFSICIATEDGTPQDMFTLGWANGASATIQIQSDVDDVVPEPSSLILLGSGLLGVATRVRRRRAACRHCTGANRPATTGQQ